MPATLKKNGVAMRGEVGKVVTLRDVAKACGLSVLPVSRVLSGSPGVNPETAEKVMRAAAMDSRILNPNQGSIVGTYAYGGGHFYINCGVGYFNTPASSAGRFGEIGRPGGYNDTPAPYYNGGDGIPMTSYFQCVFNATGTNAGNPSYACHGARGLNSAFYDGHVKWINISAGNAAAWWNTTRGNATNGWDNIGIWPYVFWADGQ